MNRGEERRAIRGATYVALATYVAVLHKLESRCVPLADATRYCAEAIEVANSAGSRSNCAAIDPASPSK